MAFIPEEIIAQVIQRCDIVETISSYIPLKRAGRNFKAVCPFHPEKTPSFIINPDKQIFHCFGCGVGGNVITFVMKQDRLEFPEAIRFLAEKVGITIPESYQADTNKTNLHRPLYPINELAMEYFHQNLIADKGPTATKAREYLKGRQVSLDIVKRFKLGFASDKWDELITFLRNKGIPLNLIEKSGLIVTKENNNGFYDRFRNRITFPIFDIKSQCLGFGARALEENPAKYINSPETAIYRKGDHLYGLQLSREFIGRQDFVIVVEGYMDFIMPFQAGVQNMVASLGTALSVEQIRLIRRYTHNVVMLFDADLAGQSAMIRSLDLLIEEGMNVKVAVLSEGEDPDSFIRKFGVTKFNERIQNAQSLFDYKLGMLMRQNDSKSIEGRAKICTQILPTLNKISNAILKAGYMKQLAETLDVGEEALLKEALRMEQLSPATRIFEASRSPAPTEKKPRVVEIKILKLILENEEFVELVKKDVLLSDFLDENICKVMSKIFELSESGNRLDVGTMLSHFEDQNIHHMISSMLAMEETHMIDHRKMLLDCIDRMIRDRIKLSRRKLVELIKEAETAGNLVRLDELKEAFNQLIKKELKLVER